MAYPPHTITVKKAPTPNSSAFEPPLQSCRIVSTLMPWVMEISAHDNAPYITVVSLLADIYNCFKKSIDRGVYEKLPSEFKELVDEAYRRRCIAIPDEEAAELAFSHGIKRIDFLLDKILFNGLQQVKSMYQTFELQLTAKY